ncbi:hypothetical protein AC579_6784 [Pseudocercospora musae]|uniref:Uncharacterized protein n=1 Tax=Pseudocercospora musae TaxID=113226 RepID=A0A139I3H3_9PEZI|nr:hypothetical protein AC579_6784 [Pseudocercospora musae]
MLQAGPRGVKRKSSSDGATPDFSPLPAGSKRQAIKLPHLSRPIHADHQSSPKRCGSIWSDSGQDTTDLTKIVAISVASRDLSAALRGDMHKHHRPMSNGQRDRSMTFTALSSSAGFVARGLKISGDIESIRSNLNESRWVQDISGWLRACRSSVELCNGYIDSLTESDLHVDALCAMLVHQTVSCCREAMSKIQPRYEQLMARLEMRLAMALTGLEMLFQRREGHNRCSLAGLVKHMV